MSTTSTARVFILTAHPGEARPLAAELGLAAVHDGPFPTFVDEQTVLTVGGQGAQAMAAAVGYLQGCYRPSQAVWLNVGICGYGSSKHALGTAVLVHKVSEGATGDTWYPQVCFPTKLPRACLTTVAAPDFSYDSEMVDMEGAGFCRAAARFSSLENLQLIKVVSDTPDSPGAVSPKRGEQLIADAAPAVAGVLNALENQLAEQVAWQAYRQWSSTFLDTWHFTATQRAQLDGLLRRWQSLHPGQSPLNDLPSKASASGDAVLKYLRLRVDSSATKHSVCA